MAIVIKSTTKLYLIFDISIVGGSCNILVLSKYSDSSSSNEVELSRNIELEKVNEDNDKLSELIFNPSNVKGDYDTLKCPIGRDGLYYKNHIILFNSKVATINGPIIKKMYSIN